MRKNEISAALRQLAKDRLSPRETERTFVSKVYNAIQDVLGAKAWKQACCEASGHFNFKSFHLEQGITAYFRATELIDIFDAIFRFFYEIPGLLSKPNISDLAPARTSKFRNSSSPS
jgi:hypothetical protein